MLNVGISLTNVEKIQLHVYVLTLNDALRINDGRAKRDVFMQQTCILTVWLISLLKIQLHNATYSSTYNEIRDLQLHAAALSCPYQADTCTIDLAHGSKTRGTVNQSINQYAFNFIVSMAHGYKKLTSRPAIAGNSSCSVFKLGPKYDCEKRASNIGPISIHTALTSTKSFESFTSLCLYLMQNYAAFVSETTR